MECEVTAMSRKHVGDAVPRHPVPEPPARSEKLPKETAQDQPLDMGPDAGPRRIGQSTGKGRPPLMKK